MCKKKKAEPFLTLALLLAKIDIIFTPLLHKDVFESTACLHQKAVSTFLRKTSEGHSWIDPGNNIDLTAIPLWVRV